MYFPKSFKGLLDFGYQRRGLEIPTFYIAYLIGGVMAGAIIGMLISSVAGSDQIRITYRLDQITASIIYLVVTHQMIMRKGLGETIKLTYLLPIITAALTLYLGHAFGLIIPTILSAQANKHTPTKSEEKPKEEQKETVQ